MPTNFIFADAEARHFEVAMCCHMLLSKRVWNSERLSYVKYYVEHVALIWLRQGVLWRVYGYVVFAEFPAEPQSKINEPGSEAWQHMASAVDLPSGVLEFHVPISTSTRNVDSQILWILRHTIIMTNNDYDILWLWPNYDPILISHISHIGTMTTLRLVASIDSDTPQ